MKKKKDTNRVKKNKRPAKPLPTFSEMTWNKQIAGIGYLHSMGTRIFSKHLKINETDFMILVSIYAMDRAMLLEELSTAKYVRSHVKMMPLITKGYIYAAQVSDMGNGSRTPYKYYLTYEGRVLMDCYYGVIGMVLDSYRQEPMKELFSGIDDVIKRGFKMFGYDIVDDIYEKKQN